MIPSKFSSLAPQHSKQWQCGHCHGWSIFVHQVRFQVRYRHGAPRLEASKYTARYAAGGICNMHGYAKICKRSTHAEIEAECSSSTCKGCKMGWIVDDNGFELQTLKTCASLSRQRPPTDRLRASHTPSSQFYALSLGCRGKDCWSC